MSRCSLEGQAQAEWSQDIDVMLGILFARKMSQLASVSAISICLGKQIVYLTQS